MMTRKTRERPVMGRRPHDAIAAGSGGRRTRIWSHSHLSGRAAVNGSSADADHDDTKKNRTAPKSRSGSEYGVA